MHRCRNESSPLEQKLKQKLTMLEQIVFWVHFLFLTPIVAGRATNVNANATLSFFFTADPQFGWGASYSGNEER